MTAVASDAEAEKRTAARANFERALGEALLFLGAHPLFEQLFLGEIEERVLPPVALRQFRLIREESGAVLAYVSWARMGGESLRRFADGEPLSRGDWNSGGELVIMDAVAPTPEMSVKAAEKVRKEALDGEAAKIARITPDGARELLDFDAAALIKSGGG